MAVLGWIADKVVTGMAVTRLRRDPVVQAGREAIRRSWTAAPETTRGLSNDFVAGITTQMGQIVVEIATDLDPRMANRKRLVSVVLELTPFELLMLPPPPTPDATGLRGKPGITGELKQRLPEIARKHKQLRDFFVPAGGVESLSLDQLSDAVLVRYRVLRGWAQMHQILRVAWHDNVPPPLTDWYRPLIENMCAWEEHNIRKLLGMEPSLGGRGKDPDMENLARSTFMNIVMSGVADPVGDWREHYAGWNL